MRCRKHHPPDLSSTVGVCASCLRERLQVLIAAQEKAHLARVSSRASDDHPRKSDPIPPPPLVFPRSVSPYVSRRKSDYASWQSCDRHNNLFYSTPQLGPTFGTGNSEANSGFPGRTSSSFKKKTGRFWIFSSLFRSRSDKFEANPRIASQESCEPSSSVSPSWFSMIFPAWRKNMDRMNSLEVSTATGRRRFRQTDRGMSPVANESCVVDCHGCDRSPSAGGYSTETSPRWRKTPSTAPYTTRRSRHVRNVSGMGFCLSPLVRASPNPHWNPKGLPPEVATAGEMRGTAAGKPHLSTASSFCANRSRKLADFGRANHIR